MGLNCENFSIDGNPAGGTVEGVGINIEWQDGPLGRGDDRLEQNGAFLVDVIYAAIQRLDYFQGSKFKCKENAMAIVKLEEATHWLHHRTQKREERKVEGTHKV